MSRALLLTLFSIGVATAQECRLSAITPSQPAPKVEEGERAVESQTFQASSFSLFAIGPGNVPHFFDTASRIRRIDPDARIRTVAGNGVRADTMHSGLVLETPLAAVSQLAFSPSGVLHFTAAGRVMRVVNGRIEVAAGSGRPGFNGESGPAADVNLGGIVNIAFTPAGELLIIDGFARVRRVDGDGNLQTVAGSARAAAAAGLTGDNGPATQAALSSPRQLFTFRDGSFWIKDLSGRHLRIVTPDGIIRTVNQNFEATVNILAFPDGSPAAAVANRVYPIRSNGAVDTAGSPYSPFTGTPLAIGSDNAVYFFGNARPEQRNPVVRMAGRVQTVIGSAPTIADVDGQAPPFGVWLSRSNALIYAATQGGKSGILESRPGQTPKFIVGGGTDVGEPDGKAAADVAIFGIVAFTVDGAGRIVIADVYRRRILVAGTDGKIGVLKNSAGEPVVYAPIGSLSNLQRIAADAEGNIYWYAQGATPAGGVFTADISVWKRSDSSIGTFTVVGLSALTRLESGVVTVIAGNSGNFRSVYPVAGTTQADPLTSYRMLPLTAVARWRDQPYFAAATRVFRGDPGHIEWLDVALLLPKGSTYTPDFILASPDSLLVHFTDGGFYRVDNIDACNWVRQPTITSVLNAASGEFANTISPRQLITVHGSGLGPAEGQGMVLDGLLRATAQPAPYPALVLGNFSGAIPLATLTGSTLPVVESNDRQITVQGATTIPASGQYLLYFSWQGLQLIHPTSIRTIVATPALFTTTGAKDGPASAINEDGSRNGPQFPAEAGSLLRLYGTGFGAISTNLALGDFFSAVPPVRLVNRVRVTVGGVEAEVDFAGGAPGQIGGTYEIRVRVPEDLAPGPQPVTVEVEGQPEPSTQQVTIHVK